MAKTLKELIKMANVIYEEYGDIPLDYEIWLNEMPSDCHKGFYDRGLTSVVEVDVTKNTTYRKW